MKILYIEDNKLNAKVMNVFVEKLWGTTVTVEVTAEKGLQRLENDCFDVVYMDLNLPGMSGIDAIKIMKMCPTLSDIPVIVVSADSTKSMQLDAYEAGCFAYVTKPVDMKYLQEVTEKSISLPKVA